MPHRSKNLPFQGWICGVRIIPLLSSHSLVPKPTPAFCRSESSKGVRSTVGAARAGRWPVVRPHFLGGRIAVSPSPYPPNSPLFFPFPFPFPPSRATDSFARIPMLAIDLSVASSCPSGHPALGVANLEVSNAGQSGQPRCRSSGATLLPPVQF